MNTRTEITHCLNPLPYNQNLSYIIREINYIKGIINNISNATGTVKSVGISSIDIDISNSPITSNGIIDLVLKNVNTSVGTFGGTYNIPIITTNSKGLITEVESINIPSASLATKGLLTSIDWNIFNNKQDHLVSGGNIKTINGNTILGSGDLNVSIMDVLNISQLNTKISNNELIKGAYYIVTDADVTLYNGTKILIQATSTNELVKDAHGLFYTPKYDIYNIWESTGIFHIGDKVFWGGYIWVNLTGLVGTYANFLFLDSNWAIENPLVSAADYNISWDIIKYDYLIDRIYYREDTRNNVVDGTNFAMLNYAENAIKVFKWGIDFVSNNKSYDSWVNCISTDNSFQFNNNTFNQNSTFSNDGVIDFIFKDSTVTNNIFEQGSKFESNTFRQSQFNNNVLGIGALVINNNLTNDSYIISCVLGVGSHLSNNNIHNLSAINNNIIGNFSSISNNVLNNSRIQDNNLETLCQINLNSLNGLSIISKNVLKSNSRISYNTLINSSINANHAINLSSIDYNSISDLGSIMENSCNRTSILSNEINGGGIVSNIFSTNNLIQQNVMLNGTIKNNNFEQNVILNLFTSGVISTNIEFLNVRQNCTINQDISLATIIYLNMSKVVLRNSNNNLKLGYLNNMNQMVYVNIDS